MKVVKLNKTHKLYHKGFTHAFRGNFGAEHEIFDICNYFERVYGSRRLDRNGPWYCGFGTSRMKVQTFNGGTYTTNPYWIAVRNEADITAALLATAR
jgi:hypothetical protein